MLERPLFWHVVLDVKVGISSFGGRFVLLPLPLDFSLLLFFASGEALRLEGWAFAVRHFAFAGSFSLAHSCLYLRERVACGSVELALEDYVFQSHAANACHSFEGGKTLVNPNLLILKQGGYNLLI